MGRLRRFADNRFVGLRDDMRVYDCDDEARYELLARRVEEEGLVARALVATFSPDTLAKGAQPRLPASLRGRTGRLPGSWLRTAAATVEGSVTWGKAAARSHPPPCLPLRGRWTGPQARDGGGAFPRLGLLWDRHPPRLARCAPSALPP